jgi:hypothetical protein
MSFVLAGMTAGMEEDPLKLRSNNYKRSPKS